MNKGDVKLSWVHVKVNSMNNPHNWYGNLVGKIIKVRKRIAYDGITYIYEPEIYNPVAGYLDPRDIMEVKE